MTVISNIGLARDYNVHHGTFPAAFFPIITRRGRRRRRRTRKMKKKQIAHYSFHLYACEGGASHTCCIVFIIP